MLLLERASRVKIVGIRGSEGLLVVVVLFRFLFRVGVQRLILVVLVFPLSGVGLDVAVRGQANGVFDIHTVVVAGVARKTVHLLEVPEFKIFAVTERTRDDLLRVAFRRRALSACRQDCDRGGAQREADDSDVTFVLHDFVSRCSGD